MWKLWRSTRLLNSFIFAVKSYVTLIVCKNKRNLKASTRSSILPWKKKKKEKRVFTLWHSGSSVNCASPTATHGVKTFFFCRTRHTVDDSVLYLQLFTCRIQFQARVSVKKHGTSPREGRSKARVIFMRDLAWKRPIFRHRARQIKVDTFHRLLLPLSLSLSLSMM